MKNKLLHQIFIFNVKLTHFHNSDFLSAISKVEFASITFLLARNDTVELIVAPIVEIGTVN